MKINIKKIGKFLKHIFWNWNRNSLWPGFMTIGLITFLAQLLIAYSFDKWELNDLWHVIGWGVWTTICIIMRVINKA